MSFLGVHIPPTITSPRNPLVRVLAKLTRDKVARNTAHNVVVFGRTALADLVRSHESAADGEHRKHFSPKIVMTLATDPTRLPSLAGLRQTDKILHVQVTREVVAAVAGTDSRSSDMLSVFRFPFWAPSIPDYIHFSGWHGNGNYHDFKAARILVLNGLRDPGNVGTLFRSAAAFGWDVVLVVGKEAVDPFNAKAMRAGKAAMLRVPWAAVNDWSAVVEWWREQCILQPGMPSVWIADLPSASSGGMSATGEACTGPRMLVLSGEAHGVAGNPIPVDELALEGRAVVETVAVPMAAQSVESLNVATAGAVLMWQGAVQSVAGTGLIRSPAVAAAR
ncbi:Alpha/beta knot methyltransferase [Blastocladiella britannica]|nr:Alpha/beta knot methyltransferase [Blastocladiella britannica]